MPGKLSRRVYARPAVEVARDLLGTTLVRKSAQELLRGRIVEVEAYTGETDPGSHAYRGPTPRTAVMFGAPGHLYVYFTYGMHYCVNVVTDVAGVAGAVLLRALEPLQGIEEMRRRRGNRGIMELCNGPGKLCQAFDITREQNGLDLQGGEVWIEDEGYEAVEIGTSTRIGLSQGRELPLRFFLVGNSYLSQGRQSAT
jgi:DNA-3-methyladenine glycosylase